MYKFGMISSPDDERDWRIPMAVDFAKPITTLYRSNKYFQSYSDCAPFAFNQWTEANEFRQRGVRIRYSPGYSYAARKDTDWQNEGMMPRELLMQAMMIGTVPYDLFPYEGTYIDVKSKLVEKWKSLDGVWLSSRIKGFVRLRTLADVYTYMAEYNLGILYGQMLYDSFLKTGTDGIVPPQSSAFLGGHLMYAPDLVMKNNELRIAVQNTYPNLGDNQMLYINISEQSSIEMWGPIPDDSKWYSDMPTELLMLVPADKTKRNDWMYVDNKKVTMPVGPFYNDDKLCTAIREPFEAIGCKVKWQRLPDGSEMTQIYPRGYEIKD